MIFLNKLFSELHKIFGMVKGFSSSFSSRPNNYMLVSNYDGEKDIIYKVTFEEISGEHDMHEYCRKHRWDK